MASVSPGGLLVGAVWVDYPTELEYGSWKDDEFVAFEDQESDCFLIGDGGHVVCRPLGIFGHPRPGGVVFVRELALGTPDG